MVVAIDPETGQLGLPTPEQYAELTAEKVGLNHTSEGLAPAQRLPDGTLIVNLDGRFAEYSVVKVGPDGKRIFGCVNTPEALRGTFDPKAPTPPALEEK